MGASAGGCRATGVSHGHFTFFGIANFSKVAEHRKENTEQPLTMIELLSFRGTISQLMPTTRVQTGSLVIWGFFDSYPRGSKRRKF